MDVNDDDEIYINATGKIFKDLRKCSKFWQIIWTNVEYLDKQDAEILNSIQYWH